MAQDNVRVLYQDGQVLGASQLLGDQRYTLGALQRRSLSRDTFGIAYGFALREEEGHIFTTPGVAYLGDGRAVISREPHSLTQELSFEGLTARFPDENQVGLHVYLRYDEERQASAAVPGLCGEAGTASVSESFRMELVDESSQEHFERLPPYAELGGESAGCPPIRLGRIEVTFDHAAGTVSAVVPLQRDRFPCADLDLAGYPVGAQYIGLIAEGIIHPQRWNDANSGQYVAPALRLHPASGIEMLEPVQIYSNLFVRDGLGDGALSIRVQSGEAIFELCTTPEGEPEQKTLEMMRVKQGAVDSPDLARIEFAAAIEGPSAEFDFLKSATLELTKITADEADIKKLNLGDELNLKGVFTLVPADKDNPPTHLLIIEGGAKVAGALEVESSDGARPSLEVRGTPASFVTGFTSTGAAIFDGTAEFNQDVTFAESVAAKNLTADVGLGFAKGTGNTLSLSSLNTESALVESVKTGIAHLIPANANVKALHAVRALNRKVAIASGPNKLIGVAREDASGGDAEIVISGPTVAEAGGAVAPGDWLTANAAGQLVAAAAGDDCVAKSLQSAAAAGEEILVIVSLAGRLP